MADATKRAGQGAPAADAPGQDTTLPEQVRARIDAQRDRLTGAESRVVAALMRDYPVAGLQSVTRLAEAAAVSTPTVIRLARKLGYPGFPEFQQALRAELSERIKAPALKRDARAGAGGGHVLHRYVAEAMANVQASLDRLDTDVFDRVAAMLSDSARPAYFVGGRITRSNAAYFHGHLQIVRANVTLLSQTPNVWPHYLLDMDPNAVLVIFDIRRYEKDLATLAGLAKARGAAIVLFTDRWRSPVAEVADHVFALEVEVPSNWDSTLAIMAVVEALVAEVQAKCWDRSRARLEALEAMFSTTRVFRGDGPTGQGPGEGPEEGGPEEGGPGEGG